MDVQFFSWEAERRFEGADVQEARGWAHLHQLCPEDCLPYSVTGVLVPAHWLFIVRCTHEGPHLKLLFPAGASIPKTAPGTWCVPKCFSPV